MTDDCHWVSKRRWLGSTDLKSGPCGMLCSSPPFPFLSFLSIYLVFSYLSFSLCFSLRTFAFSFPFFFFPLFFPYLSHFLLLFQLVCTLC